MLRIDLEAAGIPYVADGPDGPLFADFHALRHSYLTLLGKGGVDLRTAQELAAHSMPTLTARYVHHRLYDLVGAAEKLPNFLPPDSPLVESQTLRMTGTDGQKLTGSPLVSPRLSALPCTTGHQDTSKVKMTQPPENSEGCTDIHPVALPCVKVSDGIRTRDVWNHNPDPRNA